jgi:hypothetical protein
VRAASHLGAVVVLSLVASCSSDRPEPRSAPPVPSGRLLAEVTHRAAHTASTLDDGRVFVAGGCVVDGCGEASAETYVVTADGRAAVRGPSMEHRRDSHTAVVLADGRVVLAGGFAGEGEGALSSAEVVDPASMSVRPLGPLGQARGGHAAAPLDDGTILVVGGWTGPRTFTSSAEVLDPDTGTVRPAPDLPYRADALDALRLDDGRVLVTGGQVGPSVPTDAAAIFDPAKRSWEPVGPMVTPRHKHLAVLLPDGRALIIGGAAADEQVLRSTELFDPQTGVFAPGPDLAEPRYKLPGGAVVLPDGRVVIGGGGRSVEVVDPDGGAGRVVATATALGSFATLNRLGNGDLVAIGGYDDRIRLRRDLMVVPADAVEP